EDGIRDRNVTGVQTCALPICALTDALVRDRVAREWIELQALRYTNYRALARLERTGAPGPEGSVAKLRWSEANQRLTKLAIEIRSEERRVGKGERSRRQAREA